MRAVESDHSGSPRSGDRSGPGPRGLGWASRGSGITFAAMVVVLLVALLFAANQNDVIGWLLVIISAGWLVLAVLVVLGVRRGARSVDRRMKDMSASLAPRAGQASSTRVVDEPAAGHDPMRDTKLDHSFKIVQVQTRVVAEELAKGAETDTDMVARALETIEITSANARDMLQGDAGASSGSGPKPGSGSRRDSGGPISGEVIN